VDSVIVRLVGMLQVVRTKEVTKIQNTKLVTKRKIVITGGRELCKRLQAVCRYGSYKRYRVAWMPLAAG
jgi:hypothetical protein